MAYTTIDDPTIYFNTVLYAGNGTAIGSGGNVITGVNFQPDWVWIKDRTDADRPRLFDAVRGVTESLDTTDTTAETTLSEGLTSFNSDGFTVGNHEGVNSSGDNFVAWNWLAANGTASNTDGDITSTVSANTTAGFSVGLYTGNATNSTIGHGLGKKPEFIITKRRNSTSAWRTQHGSLGATKTSQLNGTNAFTNSSSVYNDTEPTSSVFTIGTASSINASGGTFVFYAFTSIQGYSKMGSYTGNGNADGPFVYTGFKPAWVLIKRTDTTGSWKLFDNKRANSFNVIGVRLEANSSGAESSSSTYDIDLVSNGFKLRGTSAEQNGSGNSFIYMAFAENPFVTSTKTAGTAR